VGKVFVPGPDGLPDEPEMLCGVMSGSRFEPSWLGGEGTYDFYDAKGTEKS